MAWSRQGDLYGLVQDKKRKLGRIPEDTCPRIDKVLKVIDKIEDDSDRTSSEKIMEELRSDNSSLRELGRSWYEFCEELCAESDGTIKDLEKEIESLEDEMHKLRSRIEDLEDKD